MGSVRAFVSKTLNYLRHTSQQLGRSISLLDLTLPLYFFQDVDGSTCAMNKGLTIDQWLHLDMKNNIHTYILTVTRIYFFFFFFLFYLKVRISSISRTRNCYLEVVQTQKTEMELCL